MVGLDSAVAGGRRVLRLVPGRGSERGGDDGDAGADGRRRTGGQQRDALPA